MKPRTFPGATCLTPPPPLGPAALPRRILAVHGPPCPHAGVILPRERRTAKRGNPAPLQFAPVAGGTWNSRSSPSYNTTNLLTRIIHAGRSLAEMVAAPHNGKSGLGED